MVDSRLVDSITCTVLVNLGRPKGGIISEKSEGFLHLQLSKKNTPKHYPKLMHPVNGNDKILIKYNKFQVKKYYSYEM